MECRGAWGYPGDHRNGEGSVLRLGCQQTSQNHRMVGVGRDLCGSPSPTLLPKQCHPEQAAEDLVQEDLEYLQRRRLHSLPGQPGPGLRHPQREEGGAWSSPRAKKTQPSACVVFGTSGARCMGQLWLGTQILLAEFSQLRPPPCPGQGYVNM